MKDAEKSTTQIPDRDIDSTAAVPQTIRVFGTAEESIVDGPGIRFAVFTQGCKHHCHGCHNRDSWGFEKGKNENISDLVFKMKKNPLISGLTLSGGDPFYRTAECTALCRAVKKELPSYNIWIWSGFTYEEIYADSQKRELLELCDILVDGLFLDDCKTMSLPWRGSSNQRVIDIRKSTPDKIVEI